jgi:hypothetical protein
MKTDDFKTDDLCGMRRFGVGRPVLDDCGNRQPQS